MRQLTKILLALALVSTTAFAAGNSEPSANILISRIAKDGGRNVLWDLWAHEEDFDHVISGIESGDVAWLKVATALRPFADGGASLGLDYAVALALPKSPNRVLALVGHGFDLEYICTSPFIEPRPGVAEAYERKTLVALSRVKSPELAPIAADCSKRVRLLPEGWRQPTASELSAPGENWRDESPTKYQSAEGNFYGDGKKNEALLLVSSDGKYFAVFVQRSRRGWSLLFRESVVHLQSMGLSTVAPGQYATACGKGYWDCREGEPSELNLAYEAILFFKEESAASAFIWSQSHKKFEQIWLSD